MSSTPVTHFEAVDRYSRQMFLFGASGQEALSTASVAVVGAGGIGSTVILYLSGAGVGAVHVFDVDNVERSNLHRQIIHSDDRVGDSKAASAVRSARQLNPRTSIDYTEARLECTNAIELLRPFDVVVDCTDNMASRFVLNDACFFLQTPLVTGSAIGFEGQATVLLGNCSHLDMCYPGLLPTLPCYRCLHPRPSVAALCQSCATQGVFGPAPGIIGCMLASEAMKCLLVHFTSKRNDEQHQSSSASTSSSRSTVPTGMKVLAGKQAYFDGLTGETVTFTLPKRRQDCPLCSPDVNVRSIKTMEDTETYIMNLMAAQEQGSKVASQAHEKKHEGGNIDKPPLPHISVDDYAAVLKSGSDHVLLDVRSTKQFSLANLGYAVPKGTGKGVEVVNVPLNDLRNDIPSHVSATAPRPLYVVCRRGISSQAAVDILLGAGLQATNVRGGLTAWREKVDPLFPDL